jgi:hypothetical protein
MGEMVQKALQAYKDGLITMPVYAATASVNREVEKQSDLMLSGLMQKHHQMIAQMLGAAANQFSPPEVKAYMVKAVESANTLMQEVFRHFGYDEVKRYVPDADTGQEQAKGREMVGAGNVAPNPGSEPGAMAPPAAGNGPNGGPAVPNGVAPMPETMQAGNPLAAILQSGGPVRPQ